MPLEISIDRLQHRNDSTVYPRITIADYVNLPFIKLHNWQYFKAVGDSFLIEPNNRSMLDCPVYLRDCKYDDAEWTVDTPSGDFAITPTIGSDGFTRSGGDVGGSWNGAYLDVSLDGAVVSIQAKATSINLSCGISLQDEPFTTHNYFTPTIAHSIIFGQNGQLSIFELGQAPVSLVGSVRYDVGDSAMIELDKVKNIVRYYLIKGNEMILLRTTRPKLTTDPVAEILLFFPGSTLEDVYYFNGAETVTTFENIAVAYRTKTSHNWQKWNNQRSRVSNADPIQLADGEFEYTFPSSKRVLRSLNLTPKSYNQTGFQVFEDFFNWHGNERNFIFVDDARKDAQGNAQEYFARFSGPMGDQTSNGCLFDFGTQIVEAYRGDYIPKQIDTTAPSVSLAEDAGGFGFALFVATATDNVGVRFCRIFVDGIQVGDDLYYSGTDEFSFNFETSGYDPGNYDVYVIAYDYAGNQTVSNTQTLTV